MSALQPFEGETRVAKADSIRETEQSVYEVARAIDDSNEALDDLNSTLAIMAEKHQTYKIKASKARKLMRRLSTEL